MPEGQFWIPATPLPFYGWVFRRCECGKRFLRFSAYERHWHQTHAGTALLLGGPHMAADLVECKRLGYHIMELETVIFGA